MKLVYICSPFAGDIENNLWFARAACRYAADQGCAPLAVHLLYPQILNDADPVEREAGIQMGLRVLASCDELWICGERTSQGMSCEIAEAQQLSIPIRNISTEQIKGGIAMKQYANWARRSAGSICGKEREIELEEAPSPGMKLQL